MDDVYRDLARVLRAGERALLATVVRTFGPAYRRGGASAVLTESGLAAGAISGGCLESDLLEATKAVLAGGPPRLMDYDTASDEDLIWGTGTGCGGRVQVLLARVSRAVSDLLEHALAARRPAVLATVVAGAGLGNRWATADGRAAGGLGNPGWDGWVAGLSREWLARGQREPVVFALAADGRVLGSANPQEALAPELADAAGQVFVQPVLPPPTLLICGAGDDAIPIARIGREVGFRVVVADHRPFYATPERFAMADEIVIALPEELAGKVDLNQELYAVLVGHNFQKDLSLLRVLLDRPVPYVGLLGARERTRRLLDFLRDEWGAEKLQIAQNRLYSPVGLDIGADGPGEIAVSIVAEALAARSGRPGGALRETRPVF